MAELLYEGKAKQVYLTEKEDEYLIHYKDDATAGNGVKHDQFEGKGVLNNTISCIIFDMLEEAGIKTHMIKKLNDRDILVKKVDIFPLEVIIRNITTGSFCKRLGAPEGIVLDEPIFEISYKNDDYGDRQISMQAWLLGSLLAGIKNLRPGFFAGNGGRRFFIDILVLI